MFFIAVVLSKTINGYQQNRFGCRRGGREGIQSKESRRRVRRRPISAVRLPGGPRLRHLACASITHNWHVLLLVFSASKASGPPDGPPERPHLEELAGMQLALLEIRNTAGRVNVTFLRVRQGPMPFPDKPVFH